MVARTALSTEADLPGEGINNEPAAFRGQYGITGYSDILEADVLHDVLLVQPAQARAA
jgi:hypothetical protein